MASSHLRAALVCHCKRIIKRLVHISLIHLQSYIGMLGTEPSTSPASQTSNTSSNLTSSQSLVSTHNTTFLTPSEDARVRRWIHLAAPLLFVTIMMPLITGPYVRFLFRIHTTLMGWWYITLPFASLSLWFLLYTYPKLMAVA